MSSLGYPDWQKIQQWLGAPLVQATGRVIGAGTVSDGPFNLASWASVVVAIKPTGGNVTVKIRQKVNGAPASLELVDTVVVPAGQTGFDAFVLFGDAVTLELTGSIAGVSVDYALYPSNTTTNAQLLASAVVNIQQNDALVAAEPTLDFKDVLGFVWSIVDDPTNTRIKITPPIPGLAPIADMYVAAGTLGAFDFSSIPQGYKHLLVIGELGSDGAADLDLYLRVNGIGTATYLWNQLKVIGAAPSYPLGAPTTQATVGFVQSNAGQVMLAPFVLFVPNYADATQKPQWLSLAGGNGFNQLLSLAAGSQQGVGALNRLFFLPSGGAFRAGSRLSLYGLG
jgi:hypothetical protein